MFVQSRVMVLDATNHLLEYDVYWREKKGSTVSPQTSAESSVLLAVGNPPLLPRLKQLSQTITGSHSRNLSLNNTVFGRVMLLKLVTGQKPLEVNNGDEGFKKGTRWIGLLFSW